MRDSVLTAQATMIGDFRTERKSLCGEILDTGRHQLAQPGSRTKGLERVMKRYISAFGLAAILSGCGNSHPADTAEQVSTDGAAAVASASQVTYDQLLASAEQLVREKKISEAIQVLTQAISLDPTSATAYVRRAALCSEANLLAQAIADMSSAIQIEPNNAKYLNTRGYFLLLAKQYDRADRDFSDAIGLDLEYVQPYNNRGLVAVAQGKYDLAIKDFDNALRFKPDYLDAHNNRGFALLQLEQLEPAIEAFTEVLKIDAGYVNALTNRARAYMKLGQPLNAAADLTKVIELQPDMEPHYLLRAEAYRAAGDHAAAAKDMAYIQWLNRLADLNTRIARSPRDADAWALRGRHMVLQSRHDEAKHSFQNALTLVPGHLNALIGRAELAMSTGDYATVVADCTEALKQEPRSEIFSLRGDAHFEMSQFGDAIADYESARRFDERVVDAYRKRAEQFRANGDEQLAKADEATANRLVQQMTQASIAVQQAPPREMVIEQTSFETPAKPEKSKPESTEKKSPSEDK